MKLRKDPATFASPQTVEAILQATAQVLEEDGEATTGRIAQRAGFSIATLTKLFPNPDAILAALAEREQVRILNGIDVAFRALDPARPELALRAALRALLGAFGSRRKLRRKVMLTLLPTLPDALRGRVVDAVLGEMLDELQQRCADRFRPIDATARFVLTRSVMGVVRAAVVEDRLDLTDPVLEDELIGLVLGVLSRPATAAPAAREAVEQLPR